MGSCKDFRSCKENGFESSEGLAKVGIYDFADLDDEFNTNPSLFKWYKFGITRTWDNLSLEIRVEIATKRSNRDAKGDRE